MNDSELLDLSIFSENHLRMCNLPKKAPLKMVKERLRWGTFGKKGDKPLKYKKLNECSTNHLNSILKHIAERSFAFANTNVILNKVINSILKDR